MDGWKVQVLVESNEQSTDCGAVCLVGLAADELPWFGLRTGFSTLLRDSGAPPRHMRKALTTTPLPLNVARKRELNKSHRKTTPLFMFTL
ncbi:jg24712 [Pararge aegeria aegeria]|uniref:Jg24712 protein n=1 Tax=Pararge aegeria aegeria TaxID=348720 RepID=A0A8S4R8H2_9NEOP|nr:jg24712 [Pararge aegeria aegeria]